MSSRPALQFAGLTDVGRVRAQNEDAIAFSLEYGFAILADGMGGYNAGEVASDMAVAGLKTILEQGLRRQWLPFFHNRREIVRKLLSDGIGEVNQKIFEKAHSASEYTGMGTTLVAAVFHGKHVTIAHAGDSRAYRFRKGELVQLTRDHTWVQEQIDAGLLSPEASEAYEYKNVLTRAVGVSPYLTADIHEYEVEADDLYLLCSDGLTDYLSLEDIRKTLQGACNELEVACKRLIQEGNDAGGHDNISTVLIRSVQGKSH